MIQRNDDSVAAMARRIYADRLRSQLEPDHNDEFVAIEPESGDFFLGKTVSEAIGASRSKHPERLAHALRVGHRATVHYWSMSLIYKDPEASMELWQTDQKLS